MKHINKKAMLCIVLVIALSIISSTFATAKMIWRFEYDETTNTTRVVLYTDEKEEDTKETEEKEKEVEWTSYEELMASLEEAE